MAGFSYTIARVFGIPIHLHLSWILLWFLHVQYFGPGAGTVIAVGLLISIAMHELGHSLVAMAKGCRVREITLTIVGGVAFLENIPRRPLDEFLMAIAGPAVSLALGIGLMMLGAAMPIPDFKGNINLVEWMGAINIALAVFNMLPAFPMDGGRILRALLSRWLGRIKATRIAALLGKAFAVFMGLVGLFGIRGFIRPGFLLVAIAIFIYVSAGAEYRAVVREEQQRRGGGAPPWPFFSARPPPPAAPSPEPDDDLVHISPPPYAKGKSERSPLLKEFHDPFA